MRRLRVINIRIINILSFLIIYSPFIKRTGGLTIIQSEDSLRQPTAFSHETRDSAVNQVYSERRLATGFAIAAGWTQAL